MHTLKYRAYIKPLKRYAEKYETILYHHQCNMEPSWTVNISPEEYYGDEELVIEQFTGLLDRNGTEIYEGDILRFDDDNGIWQAPVVFERGLFGLDVHHPKQIKNPEGWDKKYDKVDTRWWAIAWGYEETGTAFTYRTPLAKATIFRGSPEEYEESEQKKLYEKFGYGDYYVMAEVIGNIHENPELLGGK